MAGFANRIVTLTFPELTEEGEPVVHVVLRDPKTVPPSELMPEDIATDAAGVPLDQQLAAHRSREVIAKLVVGWRMFDATDFRYNPETGTVDDQAPLPLPATPELVERLPMTVMQKINTTITEAVNPQ